MALELRLLARRSQGAGCVGRAAVAGRPTEMADRELRGACWPVGDGESVASRSPAGSACSTGGAVCRLFHETSDVRSLALSRAVRGTVRVRHRSVIDRRGSGGITCHVATCGWCCGREGLSGACESFLPAVVLDVGSQGFPVAGCSGARVGRVATDTALQSLSDGGGAARLRP